MIWPSIGTRPTRATSAATPFRLERPNRVIANHPLDLATEVVSGEERLTSMGLTDYGRFLVVVTTLRDERVRVVTAFAASRRLVNLYVTQKGPEA